MNIQRGEIIRINLNPTQGREQSEQIRTLDLNQRWWKTTGEILPEDFVNLVVQTFSIIIS